MMPVGRVGGACAVQSGVENALPRRLHIAAVLVRVFHAAGAVHRLLGCRTARNVHEVDRRWAPGNSGPGARPRGAGAGGDFRGSGPFGSLARWKRQPARELAGRADADCNPGDGGFGPLAPSRILAGRRVR